MLKRKLSCHPIIIHPCWEKKEKKSQAVPRRKLKPWGLSKIVKKKRRKKRKKEAQSGQNVITVSSVTTVPGRRAKFIAREQKRKRNKGLRPVINDQWRSSRSTEETGLL
jgi:hypothetical protein